MLKILNVMRKKIFLPLFLSWFFVSALSAQVGVATTNPYAQLDVRASSQATPANTDGLLIPKMDVFPATNPTVNQQGMLIYLTTATTFSGNPKPIGFYYWDFTATDWIGIASTANGDHDWYEEGTTTPPNAITDDMFHTGNVAIGKNTANSRLDVESTNANLGISNLVTNTTSDAISNIVISNNYSGNSTDDVILLQNNYNGSTTTSAYGILNNIVTSNSSTHWGTFNNISGNGNGANYGLQNTLSGSGTGIHYGIRNYLDGSGNSVKYGIRNELNANGNQTAVFNLITGTGTGLQIGTYNEITNNNSSAHTGVLSTLSGTGTGLKTGIYSFINPSAGGTHYGIYSEVLKPGATNFAGYFLGNVGIGTTGGNMYTLPPSRGLASQIMTTDGFGNVSWQNGTSFPCWGILGNTGTNGGNTTTAGTNFLGTTDNQNIDFRTNNTFRARLSNLGEFFVGTLNTVISGDLMNAVSNAAFPWAINGYSNQDGAGVYGAINGGSTFYAAVQGETSSTSTNATGVRGIDTSNLAGTSFGFPRSGVTGSTLILGLNSGYKFGVYGDGGQARRSGGVMGNEFGTRGALGYYSSGANNYSVYGFGTGYATGVVAGRMMANANNLFEKNSTIGLGIYGGVMGGWVRGLKYGFHTKGETYSLYVDGNGYTNKPLTYLIDNGSNQKVASYMSTSIKPEVTVNGKINLQNGRAFVAFDKNFSQIISNLDDVIITATPQGKSNGVYIDQITKEGFLIVENNDGSSNVKIAWIAITKIKGEENPMVPNDLLATDFDQKMNQVMFNENNTQQEAQSLWWDGLKIRWDKPVDNDRNSPIKTFARPNNPKK